jgi:hypothetical protein
MESIMEVKTESVGTAKLKQDKVNMEGEIGSVQYRVMEGEM